MAIKILGSGNIRSPEISASTLIDDTILIDCGHSVYKRLLQPDINLSQIRLVFITHFHSDHYFDLPALLSYYDNNFHHHKDYTKLNIFLPPNGTALLGMLAKYFLNLDEDAKAWLDSAANYYEYTTDKPIDLSPYIVTPILVDHGNTKPAYGFIIKTPETTIGFSGDSIVCPGTDKIVNESNKLIYDASNLIGKSAHMGLNDVINYANSFPDKQFYCTHLSNEVRNTTETLPPNVQLLNDNDII